MKIKRKNLIPLAVSGLLILAIYLVGIKVPEETIRETIRDAGPFGVVVFIFLTYLTYVFAPLSGSPFMFAGFFLFGKTVVIYSSIATFIASITNFLIAKKWGRPLVEKLAGHENLEKVDRLIQNYGLQTIFLSRIFMSTFHDAISYVFGLTPIKFTPYLIASTLGMIPGTVIWYFLSSKLNNALAFTVLGIAIAYISLMLYLIWIKIVKKKPSIS